MSLRSADDLQLNVLNEVFERTSYPSTEEREDLARRLGMTSRSVQIWVSTYVCDMEGVLMSSFKIDEELSRWNSNLRSNGPKRTPYQDGALLLIYRILISAEYRWVRVLLLRSGQDSTGCQWDLCGNTLDWRMVCILRRDIRWSRGR